MIKKTAINYYSYKLEHFQLRIMNSTVVMATSITVMCERMWSGDYLKWYRRRLVDLRQASECWWGISYNSQCGDVLFESAVTVSGRQTILCEPTSGRRPWPTFGASKACFLIFSLDIYDLCSSNRPDRSGACTAEKRGTNGAGVAQVIKFEL